ncbi:MAG TPA: efflux RND transporter permease subunit [Candidatus Sulfopaludibacter sp.]|nr:efflux RND transporter permease subunit [Candidatus Sulfopaludibacter sp.]
MRFVLAALRRPISALVAVVAVALCAFLATQRMPVDIFPNLGAPAIYVAQPYGGMDPQQMEGFLTYYFEYHFLYITGIEHVESKNIQGASLMKLVFHQGTDMSQAMAQVVGYVNRARSFMPPGAVPPFIVRFDAGSVPVGQLVFSSPTRSVAEMQDIALNRVRPLFAVLEGVSAPPPFGGNQRTIVVRLNPAQLNAYNVSPEDAIQAVNRSSLVMPAGTVGTDDLTRIASSNATLGGNLDELLDTPIHLGPRNSVFLRDIATVESGTDIVVGYAHVNGKRTVYIPVTKRSDASTLAVIQRVRDALPKMRAVSPDDVDIKLVFDQSRFVVNSIQGLVTESSLGALLTGVMVLLFLRDWRSSLIVIITIPFSLLSALVWLWLSGQSLNIMTLGGLALAVGVLVDEATVEIENIHSLLDAARESGMSRARAVVEACSKTAIPRLLAMLCVLSVFVPSFFMIGVGRQLFVPLSLAVGFAMISSYLLSTTLVPVLATWMMREASQAARRPRWREAYASMLRGVLRWRWGVVVAYVAGAAVLLMVLVPRMHLEIFPSSDSGQFQLRLRAPTGTRIERTEVMTLQALDIIRNTVGPQNVEIESDFVGVQPASYPVNTIFLFTSGPQEAVMLVALKPTATLRGDALKEELRRRFAKELPKVDISFEAGDIVSQVMSFGSPTPIEVAVQGSNMADDRKFAEKIRGELAKIGNLRDLQYGQPFDYPTVQVAVDRKRAGQFNLTMSDVAKSLVAATSSSRFVEPNYWRDPVSGNAFQIQVQIPQNQIRSTEDLKGLRLSGGDSAALLRDVADVKYGTAMGEVDRYNMQRVVSLTANIQGEYLGDAARQVQSAIARAGTPPRGMTVAVRGQIPPLEQTLSGLQTGLLLSILVIFLLLTFNFQSLRLALTVLMTVPAVLCGVLLMLYFTGTTLNVQSFMGAIMAIGVAVANAILFVTFSEFARRDGAAPMDAALEGGRSRARAILMTASAMIVGMLPMALGLSESGRQTAPLGRAVIGGLAAATISTLLILPSVYSILQGRRARSVSLDPYDPESRYYERP